VESTEKEVNITKLNTMNYEDWKRDIRMILIMKEIWETL